MIVPDLIKAVEAGQEKARLEIQRKHHMNNRIRQLALQAGLKQRIWNSLGKELPMWQEDPDNPGLEKFAELIVKECMSQIEEVRQIKAGNAGPVYTQGFEDGMFVAIRTIEEHFGVEE